MGTVSPRAKARRAGGRPRVSAIPGPAPRRGPAPSPGGPGRRDKCRAGPGQPEEQEGAGGARETPAGSAAHGSLSGWRALYFFLRKG